MIALYILAGIVAFFVFILLSSVSVRVRLDGDASVKIGFLFLRFKVFPLKSKEKAKKRKEEHQEPKTGYIKKMIEQNGVVNTVSELLSIAKTVVIKAGKAARHIRVRKFHLLITAASDDAATTAIRYGTLCATVFPALKWLQGMLKWNDRKTKVSVQSDFVNTEPQIFLDAKIKLRSCFIIGAALGVLIEVIKKKVAKTLKNNADTARIQNSK